MTFDRTTTALQVVEGLDLSGKTMLVTGGGAGIGLATVQALASAGARVVVADINETASLEALAKLREAQPSVRIEFMKLDLGALDAVRAFAADFQSRYDRLDVLICNAGLMACPQGYTVDGHERQFGVNFLGHYLLTRLLKPMLVKTGQARVVVISSIGHRRTDILWDDIDFRRQPYDRWIAYSQSKTACALLAMGIDALWQGEGVRSNTMNPGGSNTGLHQFLDEEERRRLGFLDNADKLPDRWRSPEQCAATSAWLATSPDLRNVGGKYFEEFSESPPWTESDPMKGVRPYATSKENALRLWAVAAEMVGLKR